MRIDQERTSRYYVKMEDGRWTGDADGFTVSDDYLALWKKDGDKTYNVAVFAPGQWSLIDDVTASGNFG